MKNICKNKIFYVPDNCVYGSASTYVDNNVRPVCVYDTTDNGLVEIVPNVETYINGKPYYEVRQVQCRVSQKEFKHSSHAPYTREEHWNYPESKDMIIDWRNKEFVYEYLLKEWLVPISYKNVFYIDYNTKKDGKDYILTEKFLSHEPGFFGRSRINSITANRNEKYSTWNEVYSTYEDCEKYIHYKHTCAMYELGLSEKDWSMRDACRYLKIKGFNEMERRKYLKAFSKILNENPINELHVKDGKVWYGCETEEEDVFIPKPPDNIDKSRKALLYNRQCNYIVHQNWYNHWKVLIPEKWI